MIVEHVERVYDCACGESIVVVRGRVEPRRPATRHAPAEGPDAEVTEIELPGCCDVDEDAVADRVRDEIEEGG